MILRVLVEVIRINAVLVEVIPYPHHAFGATGSLLVDPRALPLPRHEGLAPTSPAPPRDQSDAPCSFENYL